jgi:1,4-alpha-glucan branching enzyme
MQGRVDDPLRVFGPDYNGECGRTVVYDPFATSVTLVSDTGVWAARSEEPGLFSACIPPQQPYRVRAERTLGTVEYDDPYRFGPVLSAQDIYLFRTGEHRHLWRVVGAHVIEHQGTLGTHFAVWAPNAIRVSLLNDFNGWDGRVTPMSALGKSGLWEIFIPDMGECDRYKFEILDRNGEILPAKTDPMGFGSEHAPLTASVVRNLAGYAWKDANWIEERAKKDHFFEPMSIYEVHLGSWRRNPDQDNRMLSYIELADELIPYVVGLGFTHIELLPIHEHPFDGSWGYQPIGLFAPTIRHGTPNEFRHLINAAHEAGIGVILDWVGGHFPQDDFGLARFDGTSLYEHQSPEEGVHPDWKTLIYNFGRTEVAAFLRANASFWCEEFHIDGLRVDAVSSMIMRDYSRAEGQWVRNRFGGRENLEAIDFLRRMNCEIHDRYPGVIMIAEESTSFPKVTAHPSENGLGFDFKWNMGWMNDGLSFLSRETVYRPWHHSELTFGVSYAYSENFILPLSHDEVVHGKSAMIGKAAGNEEEKRRQMMAFYAYMWAFPGKKLLFMGQEFGQRAEWSESRSLDWDQARKDEHRGVAKLIGDLNALYTYEPALHARDRDMAGFLWLDVNSRDQSVFAWLRMDPEGSSPVAVVTNLSPQIHYNWQLPLPFAGQWREALNTDSRLYGNWGDGNLGAVIAKDIPHHGQLNSATMCLPGLSTVYLIPDLHVGIE